MRSGGRRLAILCTVLCYGGALAVRATPAAALRKALTRGRALLVEVTQPDAAAASALDVEDVSARLRDAGAAALVVPEALLETVVGEQARAMGDYPGPLPVLCALDGGDVVPPPLDELLARGAAGVAVSCAGSAADLGPLSAAAAAGGAALVVVADDAAAAAAAATSGATAVACGGGEAVAAAQAAARAAEEGAVVIGAWFGDDDELRALRDDGLSGALLLDGCGGDIAEGGAWCQSRVAAFRSKASSQWGGSMFGTTSQDANTPAERNPRMWAQSQRQAREIMHESAKSRGLAPPKIKRNTVLGGGGGGGR